METITTPTGSGRSAPAGPAINRACALLWDRPNRCYVTRRLYDDAEHGGSASPYSSEVVGDAVGDDGALMGYWANHDFCCRK